MAIIALCISASNFTHAQNAQQTQTEGQTAQTSPTNRVFTSEHRAALEAAVNNPLRIDKARDKYRHPIETIEFFGVLPSDTIIEIWPGQGWYSSILGPYLKSGGGHFIGAHFDTASTSSNLVRQIVDSFRNRFGAKESEFGDLSIVPFGPRSRALGAENSVDAVLTFRNIHNWMAQGWAEKAFDDFYKVLKPGGILGIEEHRADDNSPQDPLAEDGYVREDYVIDMAKEAGFELIARSPINANHKDTKDHPFGVWTLPPVGRTSAPGQPENINFDKSRYVEIGESDRMTLLFRKPIAPPKPTKASTTIAGIRVPFPVRVVSAPKTPPPPAIIAAKKEEPVVTANLPPPIDNAETKITTPTPHIEQTNSKPTPIWRPKISQPAAKTNPPPTSEPPAPPTSEPVIFEVPPAPPIVNIPKPEENSQTHTEVKANSTTPAVQPKAKDSTATRATTANSRSRRASPPPPPPPPRAAPKSNQAKAANTPTRENNSARQNQTSPRTQARRPSPPPPPKAAPKAKAKAAPAPNRRAPEPKTKAKALNVPTWNPNPPKKK